MEPIFWDKQHWVVRATHSGRQVFPHEILGIELPHGLRGFLRGMRKGATQRFNLPMQVITAFGIHHASKGAFQTFNDLVYYYPVYVFEHEIELARWLAAPEQLTHAKQRYAIIRNFVFPR